MQSRPSQDGLMKLSFVILTDSARQAGSSRRVVHHVGKAAFCPRLVQIETRLVRSGGTRAGCRVQDSQGGYGNVRSVTQTSAEMTAYAVRSAEKEKGHSVDIRP